MRQHTVFQDKSAQRKHTAEISRQIADSGGNINPLGGQNAFSAYRALLHAVGLVRQSRKTRTAGGIAALNERGVNLVIAADHAKNVCLQG
eukprot:Skav217859  [mRNA]  locus=scaffold5889:110895:111164:+ [translate_table: standard]